MSTFGPTGTLPIGTVGTAAAAGTNYTVANGAQILVGGALPVPSYASDYVPGGGRVVIGGGLPGMILGVRTTWIGLEVLHPGAPAARTTWIGLEVLRSIADASDTGFVYLICG